MSCSTAELTRLDKGDIFLMGKPLCRDDKIRTCDLNVPNVARYQLRYIPIALDFVILGLCIGLSFRACGSA